MFKVKVQQAQLVMTVEEISHRPNDSLVSLRTVNPVNRRDSLLLLSALGEQVKDLRIGDRLRVTVDVMEED